MLNPFFLQGSKTEQSLVQDLINEQIRMYGVEIYYIPREYITEKTVIKEVIQSEFNNAYPIEAYVNTYDGYEGQGSLLSKFGVTPIDDLTLTISKERFETYITPLTENIPNMRLSSRPKEGDLIYFPLGDRIFEVKFVEHESPFYQLQKTYVYELRCELFRYEDEVLDTGVEFIDDNIVNEGYSQTLTLVGLGVTATATASIVNGGVSYIRVTRRGEGYITTPRVAISSAPTGGVTAVGIATLIGGIVDCNGLKSYKVQGVQLINSGSGYNVAPGVVFIGGGGSGAAATTVIADGIVGIVTITDGGSGYSTSPSVTFSSPGIGTTATGYAYINPAGIVTSILITNAGAGYTIPPNVTIAGSGSTVGLGTFKLGEVVTGSQSGTTARVKSWNKPLNELEVGTISGIFISGESIVGSESGAEYKIRIINTDDLDDSYADNDEIEIEADGILDFSESNPFGNP